MVPTAAALLMASGGPVELAHAADLRDQDWLAIAGQVHLGEGHGSFMAGSGRGHTWTVWLVPTERGMGARLNDICVQTPKLQTETMKPRQSRK